MTVVKHVWMTTFISVILAQQILSSRKIRSIYPGSPEQPSSPQTTIRASKVDLGDNFVWNKGDLRPTTSVIQAPIRQLLLR